MTDPWDILASEKPDFATPIEATKKEFSHLPDHTQYHLVLQLIAECEAAKSYDWKSEKKERKLDQDALADCAAVAKASSKLAGDIERYAQQYWSAIALACQNSSVFLIEKCQLQRSEGPLRPDARRLVDLLRALDRELKKKNVVAKSKLTSKTTRFGPLHFPSGVSDPKDNVVLAIHLAAQIKHYEETGLWGAPVGWQIPSKPPARWALIREWVAAANFNDFGKAAEIFLKRHPDLEVWHY